MNISKVVIVDYQLGNMFSVLQACAHVGMDVQVSSDPDVVGKAEALILPGVGAFGEAMEHLNRLQLVDVIKQSVDDNKPLLGICLGMQLLFEKSEEFGSTSGMGVIRGSVRSFPPFQESGFKIKVPQIGWNRVVPAIDDGWLGTPLESIEAGAYMYFVHSFICVPEKKDNILCKTNYGGVEYCSAVQFGDHLVATQFHPEKSGKRGLSIYESWVKKHELY